MKVRKYNDGKLYTGDCIEHMKYLVEQKTKVDLVFADPPFNIGFTYDQYDDNKTTAQYIYWSEKWLKLAIKLLKSRGSIFVAIGDENAANLKLLMDNQGLHMRNWIIWNYNFGVYCKKKFGRDHTHILYYVKDPKKFTFNADDILVPSYRQTVYKDKRAESKGRVPGDVWQIKRVAGTHQERNDSGHGCQMPEEVMERIIKVASNPGETVYDPFSGSGTTLAVARKLGRNFLGSELSKKHCRGIHERLQRIDDSETHDGRRKSKGTKGGKKR